MMNLVHILLLFMMLYGVHGSEHKDNTNETKIMDEAPSLFVPGKNDKIATYMWMMNLYDQILASENKKKLESSFQKNQWFRNFQFWVLRWIHNQNFRRHIVNLIYSYVYEPFIPITGNLCQHDGGLWRGVISRNGQWFLSTTEYPQQYLYLSDLSTGNKVRTFKTPNESELYSCAIANSRLFVAGGSRDKMIYLWNTNSGDLLTTLNGHKSTVTCLCVTFNDTRIISGSWDYTIRMWSVEDTPGNCLFVLRGHTRVIRACFVSVDTTRIVSTSYDGTLRVWDSYTEECIQNHPIQHCTLQSAIMSEDNQSVGFVTPDCREIKVWNINNGEYMETIQKPFHLNHIFYSPIIFYLSVDRLVCGNRGEVYVWDLKTKKTIYTLTFDFDVNAYVQIYTGMVDRKYLIIVSKQVQPWIEVYSFDNGALIN